MPVSERAMEFEMRSIGAHGEPTLGLAYELIREQWRSGERDRELALHLMFLAWYLNLEPPHLTGFDSGRESTGELPALFNEAHDWLLPRGAASDDAEALYAAGLAACLCPWLLGDERVWTARSEAYRARYRRLAPGGIDASVFAARGAYGAYHAHQVCVTDGY